MPVISPRRSSTSASGSLYGTTSSSTPTGGTSSSLGSSGYSSAGSSYLDRASSLSKTSASSSSYSPSYSSYLSSSYASSYTPRTAYRSSASSSSYLSGGSAALGTYRSTSSYLGTGSNDTNSSSRYGYGYGLNKNSKPFETTTLSRKKDGRDSRDETSKKPPSGSGSGSGSGSVSGSGSSSDKRLAGSNSSSSLARLVATSGLDMYEKYSPAHYKPNCELTRSRSAVASDASEPDSDSRKESAATHTTLERPRSRYSRLYGADSNDNNNNTNNDSRRSSSNSSSRFNSNYNKSETDVVDNISSYSSRSSRRSKLQNSASATSTSATATLTPAAASGSLSNSSSSGDVPTATFTLRSKRLLKPKIQDDNDDSTKPKNGLTGQIRSGSNGIDALKNLKLSSSTDNIGVSGDSEVPAAADVASNGNDENADDPTAVSSANDGDVSTSATLKLDTHLTKGNKQKCDPVLKVQQQQQQQQPTLTDVANEAAEPAAKSRPTSPTPHSVKNSRHYPPQTTTSTNTVRAANQNFFLIPAFKDQNFLKEECELAHAQVAATSLNEETTSTTDAQLKRGENNAARAKTTSSEDTRNNNNNNSNSRSAGHLPRIAASNGMRRSGGGSVSDGRNVVSLSSTTATATATATKTPHRIDIVFNQIKAPLASHAATTIATTKSASKHLSIGGSFAAGGAALTSTAIVKNSGGGGRHQVKPLVHRSIPSTAVAAANAISYSNKLNNNQNNSGGSSHTHSYNNVNSSNSNNNMQHAHNEPDDIKYIDSDEAATSPAERKSTTHCEQRCCMPPSSQAPAPSAVTSTKIRVRPKSTIICSSAAAAATAAANSQLVFEKVNNYKYANGSNGSETTAAPTTNSRRVLPRYSSGIDSSSIKASIEKFNSFSERQRMHLNSVTLRSHSGGGGSTSNLQHHHHHHRHSSSDFDNSNLRLSNSGSGGGSLTRTPYRSAAASAVSTGGATSSAATSVKIIASIQHPVVTSVAAAAAVASSSARTSAALGSNSLPTATKSNRSHELATLSRTVAERASATSLLHVKHDAAMPLSAKGVATATVGSKKPQSQPQDAALEAKKHVANTNATIASSDFCDAADESVRSTSIRSVLPPPSPTASRYWDRDSSGNRTSSSLASSSSTYTNNSTADAELNKSSTSSSDEKAEGLCGLRNIGNTCFMNSVIQCLSHTSELTKFLRSHNGLRSSSSKDQQILHEFAKLIREMWTSNVHSVTPLELKRAFSTKHRMYSDYNQQDAQEFLRFFLDSLHGALNTGVKGELLKIDDNLSDNKKADQTWDWYARHENSLIRDLFVGQLKSTLKCTTCGNTSVTFDPFWDLSVSLPSSSRCKLDACLDMFIREEILDGDEMPTCSKCQTRRRCTKSFAIQRFPKYLVIHLKRFSETRWSKLSNIVEFPTGERELNMRTYGSNPNANIYYSLYAISNHMGSTAGGHYVALCKHPVTKKWHEFNDNIVSDALSENHLVSSSAYILFYERV